MKRKRSFRRLLRSVAAGDEITIASRGVPLTIHLHYMHYTSPF